VTNPTPAANEVTLKPCPFCGVAAVRDGERARVEHNKGCYLLRYCGSTQLWLSLDEKSWNTRPASAEAPARVDAIYRAAMAVADFSLLTLAGFDPPPIAVLKYDEAVQLSHDAKALAARLQGTTGEKP
jgi:hypothetical protein